MSYSRYLDLIERAVNWTRPYPVSYRNQVRRVAVILTASRSGSSYLKNLLMSHPDIAALTGEEEPYYILSMNGFPFNSDSDEFHRLNYVEMLASYIYADLSVFDGTLPTQAELVQRWRRRLPLQLLRYVSSGLIERALNQSEGDTTRFLEEVAGAGAPLYDEYPGTCAFSYDYKIEEPPFVTVDATRRGIQSDEVTDKILLFKTPQNAYRAGIFEQLFPSATISYIHLTRGFAQTVNGLLDGWLSNYGFFAHNLEHAPSNRSPKQLDIAGYNSPTWWKFDLPPNWRDFIDKPLPLVCLNQWMRAHQAIRGISAHQIRLEDLVGPNRQRHIELVFEHIGLKTPDALPWNDVVMSTDKPQPFRWRKREQTILDLAEQRGVQNMMLELGYDMRPENWI